MKKWNYKFSMDRKAIPFWKFDEGIGEVQSPKPIK